MPGKKYNNEDIQRILKSAAERQQRDHARQNDGEGLSLEELERIAAEAGIDPRYIREAARETSSTITIRKESKLVGGVTDMKMVRSVPAFLESNELAAELVPVVREVMGKNGVFEVLGNTISWNEGNGPSASYTDVSIKSDHEESQITAGFTRNVKVTLYIFNILPYFFALLTLIALTTGTDAPAAIFFAIIFVLGSLISRFGLARWSHHLADNLIDVVDNLEDKLLEAGTPTITHEATGVQAGDDHATRLGTTSNEQPARDEPPLLDADDVSDPDIETRTRTRSKDRS